MSTKRIHFPQTTAQQRKLLFETWEATGNVTAACRKAHVGRGTFYYWKPRFDKDGYAGLEEFESRAPKEPYRTPSKVEQRVIGLRREHPDWGKKRIADELAKVNNWVPLVSPNTVKRIRDGSLCCDIGQIAIAMFLLHEATVPRKGKARSKGACKNPANI